VTIAPGRRSLLVVLGMAAATTGCAPTGQQQAEALGRPDGVPNARARESRRFDTADVPAVLRATLGALQDSGFTVEETQAQFGVITASKIAGARIRVQVVLRRLPNRDATLVRATFQRVIPRPGAMLAGGEVMDDPLLYREFFERLEQSLYLTANEI
jgi:hypothetical protein